MDGERVVMPERLEEAARVLRERAEAATPGPWTVAGPYESGALYLANDDIGATVAKFETTPRRDENVRFIAMMHPGVALAFADVLEIIAYVKEYEQESDYFGIGDKADQALHAADLIPSPERDARIWNEGYSEACANHGGYSTCGEPESHMRSHINPYLPKGKNS